MESNLSKPVNVFISYSHYDKQYLEETSAGKLPDFIRYIQRLEKYHINFYWDKNFISAGDFFDEKIKRNLEQCDILLALISDDFLYSVYCIEKEVNSFLKDISNGTSKKIIPFYISYCEWNKVEWIKSRHMLPSDNTPYSSLSKEKQIRTLIDLRNAIKEHAIFIREESFQ